MTGTGRVLIAPDKFKGSLTAAEAADRIAAGVRRAAPAVGTEVMPVADGGEGTVDAAVAAGFARRVLEVTGPVGVPVRAAYALRGDTAVVELAEASGLRRLPGGVPAPLTATTYGTGELIRAALDAGARTVVLGVGGSAATDGGAGMLTALGARFTDASGGPAGPGGAGLATLTAADLSGLDPRIAGTDVVLASDVDNPLTGPEGASAVYGPQKGATAGDMAVLDAALARFAAVLERGRAPGAGGTAADARTAPGAGAAGGAGFGALAGLGAVRRPGIEVLLDVLGFPAALDRARLVITGEGALDEQTLRGKAPAGVARAARERGIEVVAVCGRLALGPARLASAGFSRAYALLDIEPDPARCTALAGPLLERVAETAARDVLSEAGADTSAR